MTWEDAKYKCAHRISIAKRIIMRWWKVIAKKVLEVPRLRRYALVKRGTSSTFFAITFHYVIVMLFAIEIPCAGLYLASCHVIFMTIALVLLL